VGRAYRDDTLARLVLGIREMNGVYRGGYLDQKKIQADEGSMMYMGVPRWSEMTSDDWGSRGIGYSW
jgi:hypothetical protein